MTPDTALNLRCSELIELIACVDCCEVEGCMTCLEIRHEDCEDEECAVCRGVRMRREAERYCDQQFAFYAGMEEI